MTKPETTPVEYVAVYQNYVEQVRGGRIHRNPTILTPCLDCRALVLGEDMAEHRALAHDSYYPDPRRPLERYGLDANQISVGDVILGDRRSSGPVTTVDALAVGGVRFGMEDGSHIDLDDRDYVMVLRRRDYDY